MDLLKLKGIGPKRKALFETLGIQTVEDLLLDFPRRYEDRTTIVPIDQLQAGERAVVRAEVVEVGRPIRLRGRRSLLYATIEDASATIRCVWHNQPYRAGNLNRGDSLYFYGAYHEEKELLVDPVIGGQELLGFYPIYNLTEGLTNAMRIQAVRQALALVEQNPTLWNDPFPAAWRMDLMPLDQLLRAAHAPKTAKEQLLAAREMQLRTAIEDALLRRMIRAQRAQTEGVRMEGDLSTFLARLPYRLTGAQEAALETLRAGLRSPQPMNMLLQGDVGSGKTVVALALAEVALLSGYSVAMMAPTEVLARQHAKTAEKLLPHRDIFLLTGSSTTKDRAKIRLAAVQGDAAIFIGTHALFQDAVRFPRLGLVITDEQHRFGVRQRGALQEKLEQPNTVVLSATPIPRTLKLVDWGDLDLVRIPERPPGRKPITTRVIDGRSEKAAYLGIAREILKGHRAYVVCPLIEKGEKTGRDWSVDGVAKRMRALYKKEDASVRIACLTGPMPAEEKERALHDFATGEIDVLVATTVVEVGIDVPEATVMMVVGAERFGLAQLHQLRGRVGRSDRASYCLLLMHEGSHEARERLHFLETTEDGFQIARFDLLKRGGGTRIGVRQHGAAEVLDPMEEQESRRRAALFLKKHGADQGTIPPEMARHLEKKLAALRQVAFN